jgi:hypothetical protein
MDKESDGIMKKRERNREKENQMSRPKDEREGG